MGGESSGRDARDGNTRTSGVREELLARTQLRTAHEHLPTCNRVASTRGSRMKTLREHIRRRLSLLDMPIDALSWQSAVGRIRKWAANNESRYVCLCNVHSLVTGYATPALRQAIANADTAAPDGMPVAWLMRHRGVVGQ